MATRKRNLEKICFIYLLSIPFLVTGMAFIIGHSSYRIYIPIWLFNAMVMVLATRTISKSQSKISSRTASFFIFPWILFTIFAGMGPPPETAMKWALNANEQLFRYSFLIAGGISLTIGFTRFEKELQDTTGSRYAGWGSALIKIALPLFILNMAYWGYFLTNVFIIYSAAHALARPNWIKTVGEVFIIIRMTEVALIYFATAAIARALRVNELLSKPSYVFYIFFTCSAALANILPSTIAGPLAIANYLSYIPAFTFLMPYFIAVNLLANSLWKKS